MNFDRLSFLANYLTEKFNPADEFSDAGRFAKDKTLVNQFIAGLFFGMDITEDSKEWSKVTNIVGVKMGKLPKTGYHNGYTEIKIVKDWAFWKGVKAWGMILSEEFEAMD